MKVHPTLKFSWMKFYYFSPSEQKNPSYLPTKLQIRRISNTVIFPLWNLKSDNENTTLHFRYSINIPLS